MLLKEFIKSYWNNLALDYLLPNPILSLEMIKDRFKLNIPEIIWRNPNVDLEFIAEKFGEREFGWYSLSSNPNLSIEFIDQNSSKLDWINIAAYYPITPELFQKYSLKLSWTLLSLNKNLSLDLIEQNINDIDWWSISSNPNLDIAFIEKHFPKFRLEKLSENPSLSLEFIKNNLESLDLISICQNPSIDRNFILENKLIFKKHTGIFANPALDIILAKRYFGLINWSEISKNPNIVLKFFIKNFKSIQFRGLSQNHFTRQLYLEDKINKLSNLKIEF